MGNCENCPYKLSDDRMYEAEKELLEKSGFPITDFTLQNVQIDELYYVRTISIGDKSKPVLVLVHGYGGAGVMFYKVIKAFVEHYYVILID